MSEFVCATHQETLTPSQSLYSISGCLGTYHNPLRLSRLLFVCA